MSNKIKDIHIKNRRWYFFNDIINIEHFDPNNIKIDEKSYKNIVIYYIGHLTIKDSKYVRNYSVNPFYLIFRNVNGYFEEIKKSKYLTLFPTNKSKGKTKRCTAQKKKLSIKDFSSKCYQLRWNLRILSHVLEKSLMENLIFCAVIWRTME